MTPRAILLSVLSLNGLLNTSAFATTVVGDYGVSTTGYVSTSQLVTQNVSLTSGATTWGYISSTGSYLPNFATNRISTTNISVTNLTMSGTPTATTDAANKAYVDAAVVAAAGVASSGMGAACYTVYSGACASGWQQMPGYTYVGNGQQVNNCCLTSSSPPSDAFPIGYAVRTESDYSGNLGGLSGANAICLAELQNKPWAGRADAQNRGILTPSKVKAYLCDGTTCNNFQPYARYYSAVTGSLNQGQGYAESAGSENISLYYVTSGPYYYLVGSQSSGIYWTGRNTSGSSGSHCSGWTSNSSGLNGTVGKSSEDTAVKIYSYNSYTCNQSARLVCLVNP